MLNVFYPTLFFQYTDAKGDPIPPQEDPFKTASAGLRISCIDVCIVLHGRN